MGNMDNPFDWQQDYGSQGQILNTYNSLSPTSYDPYSSGQPDPVWAPVQQTNISAYDPNATTFAADPATPQPAASNPFSTTSTASTPSTPTANGGATSTPSGGTNVANYGQIPAGYGGTSTGSTPSGNTTGLTFDQQGYWDPQSYARGYQHVLDEMGLGSPFGNPASRFAQQAAQRGYAQYLLQSLMGTTPTDSTESQIRQFVGTGGSQRFGNQGLSGVAGQFSANPASFAGDPRAGVLSQLNKMAWESPQQLANIIAGWMPRSVGSAGMGQYLYQAALQQQNAKGVSTPTEMLQTMLAMAGF